jgi:DNA-directed RNA polymerase subunit alpha
MEIKLDWGKGYILADNQNVEAPIDFLRVDAIFMPIRRVNYQIKSILSEDLAPKEQLIFEVWTNGSITPHDAIIQATKIITNWFEPIKSLQTTTLDLSNDKESKNVNELPIEELHLSARAYNGLKRAQIDFIGQILKYSLNDLKEIKNFGQKSVQEVIDALQYRYAIILEQTNVT